MFSAFHSSPLRSSKCHHPFCSESRTDICFHILSIRNLLYVFSSDGSLINWAGLGSATLMDPPAPAFESEVETASVAILSGQQRMILWSQKPAASMFIQSCFSSFSFNGLSLIPTDGDLGTIICADNKFYGFSSVATQGVPLLFVSDPLQVRIFAIYVDPGTPTVPQHPQLRLLSSIAIPYVKNVVATDVSNAVTAFSFMVGRSSNDALESILYETLP